MGSGLSFLLFIGIIFGVICMARKPRIHYPGALYHVMVRGNNGESIFFEETHKRKYISLLKLYKKKCGYKLYAFCIMDNHAHLLIQVNDVPLSRIMQGIQQVYTQWFNSIHKRTGHVFQQRYKALLCDKDNYLFQLIKYIHYNPVKAKLNGGLEYDWSSHCYYIGKDTDNLVDIFEVLNTLSENKHEALKQYLQFICQDIGNITYQDIKEFQPSLDTIECKKTDAENGLNIQNIDEIIKNVCNNENVTIDDITKRTKVRRISDIRKAIVILSDKYSNVTNKELAKRLNLSLSMISRIKSGNVKNTAYLADVIRRWEESKKVKPDPIMQNGGLQ